MELLLELEDFDTITYRVATNHSGYPYVGIMKELRELGVEIGDKLIIALDKKKKRIVIIPMKVMKQ